MKSKNKLDTTDKLPRAKDIRDFALAQAAAGEGYKNTMSEVRSAIRRGAARGKLETRAWLHDADEVVAQAVVGELTSAGYRASLTLYEGYRHYPDHYALDIRW